MYDDNLRQEVWYLTFKYSTNSDLCDCDTRLTRAKRKRLERLSRLDHMAWDGPKSNPKVVKNKKSHAEAVKRFLFLNL